MIPPESAVRRSAPHAVSALRCNSAPLPFRHSGPERSLFPCCGYLFRQSRTDSHPYPIRMLHLVHHKHAFQRSEVFDRSQHIQHEFLIILHVRSMDFEQVVKAAGNVIAFRHFRNVTDNAAELLRNLTVQTVHLDVAEHHKAAVKLFRIKHRYVFLYVSAGFQAFEPLEHRRGRKADPGCKLLDCQPGILL